MSAAYLFQGRVTDIYARKAAARRDKSRQEWAKRAPAYGLVLVLAIASMPVSIYRRLGPLGGFGLELDAGFRLGSGLLPGMLGDLAMVHPFPITHRKPASP